MSLVIENVGSTASRSRRCRGSYAASLGILSSTNRKNRVLRAPATNDSCDTGKGDPEGSLFAFRSGRVLRPPATNDTGDSEFSESPDSFRKDRVLCVPATRSVHTIGTPHDQSPGRSAGVFGVGGSPRADEARRRSEHAGHDSLLGFGKSRAVKRHAATHAFRCPITRRPT